MLLKSYGPRWHVQTTQSAKDNGPVEHPIKVTTFCLTVRITVVDVEVEVEDNNILNHFQYLYEVCYPNFAKFFGKHLSH